MNKRLKGTDKVLLGYRDMFERSRTCWLKRQGTWLALDFEGWEYDHKLITEYGWSKMTWENDEEKVEDGHILVEEYLTYRNTTFVEDNRDVGFIFFSLSFSHIIHPLELPFWRE